MPKFLNFTTFAMAIIGLLLIIVYASNIDSAAGNYKIFLTLLKELGFALWVSILIFSMFEHRGRSEFEESLNQKFSEHQNQTEEDIQRIASNVFFGVYKRNIPEQLIHETSASVLEQSLIKTDTHINYNIRDKFYKIDKRKKIPFVCLAATVNFTVKNISADKVKVPIGLHLPNPIIKEMIDEVCVESLSWKFDFQSDWNHQDVVDINTKLKMEMENESKVLVPAYADSVELKSNDVLHIQFKYVMAKETEDTEVLSFATPTDGVRITINDHPKSDRVINARALHRDELEVVRHGATPEIVSFRLSSYLLPQQGIVFWWKKSANVTKT